MTFVVGLGKASCAENAGIIGGARLAVVCRFANLEDVTAWVTFCGSSVFGTIDSALCIA
jgi:hypothetical protein